MEKIIEILKMAPEYLGHIEVLLVAMIAFFMVIPGHQPEAFLQKVVDIIKKFSRK